IGHADSAHAVDSATYAHTRLWRYLAEFLFNPLRAISVNFLEAAFIRDKLCAQLPGGTASFELLRVFVDHRYGLDAQTALFSHGDGVGRDAWGISRAETDIGRCGVVFRGR